MAYEAPLNGKVAYVEGSNECHTVETAWYIQNCYFSTLGDPMGCSNWEYIGSSFTTYCATGGGGGYGYGDTGENGIVDNIDGAENICPASFRFTNVISTADNTGGWQVAVVSGIHMNILSTTGDYILVTLPTMFFGMPVLTASGTSYSAELASQISARAIDYAERQVMEEYHNNGGVLVNLSTFFREKINEYMLGFGGKATRTPGNIPGLPGATVAQYDGITGICW